MNGELVSSKLAKIPLFRGLNETECRQIADISKVVLCNPGDVVLAQGEATQSLFILLEGKCEVVRQVSAGKNCAQPMTLAVLEPYAHCGEMSFFHKAPHSATVRAVTVARLIKIDHGEFSDLIFDGATSAYKIAFNCLQALSERLRKMDAWVADLLCEEAAESAASAAPEWNRFREKLFQGLNL